MSNINIKNLPETSDINFGDFLLIENVTGTQIIKYDNFIISEKNITFQPLLSTHTSNISFNLSQIKALTANTGTLSGFFNRIERVESSGGDMIYTLSAVGINHSNPGEKLTVNGNISASGSLSAAGGGYSYIESNLGVGTRSPTSKFHIAASSPAMTIQQTAGPNANGCIKFQGSGGVTQAEICTNAAVTDVGNLEFRNAGTTNMILRSNGTVGIGTTVPSTTLHLGGSGTLGMVETMEHPLTPVAGSEAYFYVKADKFIIKFNDGGTLRYKYLVLSGDRVTWVQTLSAP